MIRRRSDFLSLLWSFVVVWRCLSLFFLASFEAPPSLLLLYDFRTSSTKHECRICCSLSVKKNQKKESEEDYFLICRVCFCVVVCMCISCCVKLSPLHDVDDVNGSEHINLILLVQSNEKLTQSLMWSQPSANYCKILWKLLNLSYFVCVSLFRGFFFSSINIILRPISGDAALRRDIVRVAMRCSKQQKMRSFPTVAEQPSSLLFIKLNWI